jgi:hypothetical protein
VHAVVEVKGRILAHEQGMRAEMARILALAVPGPRDKRNDEAIRHVKAAATRYSVPVISQCDLALFSAGYGGVLPASMRPGKRWLADGGGTGASSIAA